MNYANNTNQGILSGLKSLVFPEICICCQEEFLPICNRCQSRWLSPVQSINFKSLRINSLLTYDSNISKVVLQAKENRNRIGQELMASALKSVLKSFELEDSQLSISKCLLVPIPSSRSAIRKRGGSFLHPILNKLLDMERGETGLRWRWAELLSHNRSVFDQSGLSYTERQSNMAGVFRIRDELNLKEIRERPMILIDDVLTTGATLYSAFRALSEINLTVLGAATACASAHRLLIR